MIPNLANQRMKDPVFRNKTIKKVPIEIQEFIHLQFPTQEHWDRIIYGIAKHEDVRKKINQHIGLKLDRARIMNNLRTTPVRVKEQAAIYEETPVRLSEILDQKEDKDPTNDAPV